MPDRYCELCGCDITGMHGNRKYCVDCQVEHETQRKRELNRKKRLDPAYRAKMKLWQAKWIRNNRDKRAIVVKRYRMSAVMCRLEAQP